MDDCNGYERDLARLMDEALAAPERDRLLDALRRHGTGCAGCRASLDLVEVLALPPDDREAAGDPRREYWTDFNARVRQRIEVAETETARPIRWGWGVAAAAALVLVALGVRGIADRSSGPAAVAAGVVSPTELPTALVDSLSDASPAEVTAQIEALSGWGSASRSGGAFGQDVRTGTDESWGSGLFPDVEELSAEERRELLSWLKSQAS